MKPASVICKFLNEDIDKKFVVPDDEFKNDIESYLKKSTHSVFHVLMAAHYLGVLGSNFKPFKLGHAFTAEAMGKVLHWIKSNCK